MSEDIVQWTDALKGLVFQKTNLTAIKIRGATALNVIEDIKSSLSERGHTSQKCNYFSYFNRSTKNQYRLQLRPD